MIDDAHRMGRRALLARAGLLSAAAATGSFLSVQAKGADTVELSMQLGWLASNGLMGEVAAMRQGFYEEQGIELSIIPGGPNVDGVASVAAGRAGVGQLSSSPSLMLARSAGIPVKAIAAGYHTHPFTYFSLGKNPIRTPQDMAGKTIATQPTAFILARALLAKHGIPESEVTLVNMGSDMNQLLTGQADAVTGWLTNTNALEILGPDRVDMRLWDAGLQLYANVYYTTDAMLADQPDALARFLRGSAQGWGWVRENPEAAVDLLVDEFPNLERESELQAVRSVIDFSFGPVTKKHGWGHMDPENWNEQVQTYADLGQFEGDVPKVEDVMTTAILEATADVRKRVG
jgi:NitT/TauT family transport system substrate-binding protein